MKVKQDAYDVGVIVGRFQVPELHEAHRALIQHVIDDHAKVIVFLGLSPLMVTRENPLDYEARKQMLLEAFPEITVAFIRDVGNDLFWSRELDKQIGFLTTPNETTVLYGGRDSFVERYHGKYPTRELEPDIWVSGTEIRRRVSKRVKATADFRRGVTWAAYNRFPTAYPTVDVAIINADETKVLLGRKPDARKYQFIGGFAEPDSPSFEHDAQREVQEETGIEIFMPPRYLGSYRIDDWRYRGEVDQIKTLFFYAKHMSGDPEPNEELDHLKWFDIVTLDPERDIMPLHRPLAERLKGEWAIRAALA